MKPFHVGAAWVLAFLLSFSFNTSAAIYYVAQNSSPAPPYASWSTAATNIQDALNLSTNGDEILVTNGVYAYGGLAMAGTLTNRVALTAPVTLESVNGPWVTIIQGAGATNGPAAVRCAWLTNGASLIGFTLQGGATANSGTSATLQTGGAVWCASSNAVVANCVIISNTAAYFGGGVYQGSIKNCLVTRNSGSFTAGGAAAYALMTSCTMVSNTCSGVYGGTYTNCVVYYNTPQDNPGSAALNYSCTSASAAGTSNITAAPLLFADGVHLLTGSPCIGAGVNRVSGTDIFGVPWSNPPCMGCAQWQAATLVSRPQLQLTGNPAGFTVGNAVFTGQAPYGYAWLLNGVPLANNGNFTGAQSTNLTATGVNLADAGNYQLVVTSAWGSVTSQVATLVIHCVAATGTSPAPPYIAWTTAATNIQDAITAAAPGDVVLVTNGLYAHGGISMDGVITNRVSVNKGVLVQSVNGSGLTVIQGALDPVATNGPGAVRCAWLTNNAVLSGFTLLGGATRSGTGGASTWGGGNFR